MSDPRYWLAFNQVSGIGPAKVQQLLNHFGDLGQAWEAGETAWQASGLDQSAIANLRQARATLDLDRALEKVQQAGASLLHWDSPDYPRALREIPYAPPLLYCLGGLAAADEQGLAVVGTRRLTRYGRQVTRELVSDLVRQGLTIVSGLARGIDAVAHEAALEAGGRTIAVLGSGLDQLYPPENRRLARRIVDEGGAVITEYALGTRPEARNFPPRNRIISGLSRGVLVVEANERSGALITVRFALEQDREVFAVPGPISSPASRGPNRLIQEGAKLVTAATDILEELNIGRVTEERAVQLTMPASSEEILLLQYLGAEPLHIDELTRRTGLPAGTVSSTLALMELKGMVQPLGDMNYAAPR